MAYSPPKKRPKDVVQYREQGTPERHCSLCSMWRDPNSCTDVEGTISPKAVCRIFYKKG